MKMIFFFKWVTFASVLLDYPFISSICRQYQQLSDYGEMGPLIIPIIPMLTYLRRDYARIVRRASYIITTNMSTLSHCVCQK